MKTTADLHQVDLQRALAGDIAKFYAEPLKFVRYGNGLKRKNQKMLLMLPFTNF